MRTTRGTIVVTLDGVLAPLTVLNYATLAEKRFYDGLRFHRVVPGFVAQDGDPRGDGEGGPGYTIRDELTLLPYVRGAVGMALSGPDTGGSQYFLTLTPQPHLDGHYTVFGLVTSGLNVMDALVEGDAISSVRVR
jgi:cyclophilin family peptidyl-prolyl cis-trans isomerase